MQSNKTNTDLVCPGYLIKKIHSFYFNDKEIREINIKTGDGYKCLYNSVINIDKCINIELFETNTNKWYSLSELNSINNYQYLLMLNFTHVRTKIKK